MDSHFQGKVVDNKAGSALLAAAITASAGFGSTVVKAVTAGSSDVRGRITLTPGGAGIAANPTFAIAFQDGAFDDAPFVSITRADVLATAALIRVTARSTTGFTVTFVGTPVDGEAYIFDYFVRP